MNFGRSYHNFELRNLTLVIPGIVSIDHVHCQSKSKTIYRKAYAVDTLKMEIEAVKGRKMSFSHSYHNHNSWP